MLKNLMWVLLWVGCQLLVVGFIFDLRFMNVEF